MTFATLCSAKDVTEPGTHPPAYREFAPRTLIVLWFLESRRQNMELSSPFIAGLWFRHGSERARCWQALQANFPAAVWLHLPPSTGLQLAVLVHRLQTLNWHMCIVQMGQSHRPAWN